MRSIELLAPARDLQTGIEAIRHGADAVYIGAPRFGARAAAGNSVEDISRLVEFARPYGVKIYVTLNTILYDDELGDVHRLVGELEEAGVDALIVQDMALIGSNLPLHASTQMDNRTAEKVAWLRGLGFRQVVLARELTLDEIREIHHKVPDVRLEAFVHGAICVSFNGQCYASQYCFGRSANRGECAQFCRMPFDLVDGQGHVLQRQRHLLSLRDMNRSDDLEAMLDAGISSLKIEGRLKDVGYVKNIVAFYRQRLDAIFRRSRKYCRSSLGHETIDFEPNPAKSFNRLFTNYFLHGRTPGMANLCTPKSMGEPLPPLTSGNREAMLHNGDGLCYINEEGHLEGTRVNRVEAGRIYLADGTILPSREWPEGRMLYRNFDHDFEQCLSKPTATRKVGVRWSLQDVPMGFRLCLTREDGASVEQTFEHPHELARTPQHEQIGRQLSRLGDTPYESLGVDIDLSQNWFIPGSTLAEWRRAVSGKLSARNMDTEAEDEPTRADSEQNASPLVLHSSLTYLANVANHKARQFYLDQGADRVDWALEADTKRNGENLLLMTCRYCIRHELGMCRRAPSAPVQSAECRVHSYLHSELRTQNFELRTLNSELAKPLLLRLANGRQFRLKFDCKQCLMMVYAENK